jgi:hypothetical protein
MATTTPTDRAAMIPLCASPRVDPERLARMWSLTPDEREAAARRGELSLGEMCRWASRFPAEIEIVAGEFWFLAAFSADDAFAPTKAV